MSEATNYFKVLHPGKSTMSDIFPFSRSSAVTAWCEALARAAGNMSKICICYRMNNTIWDHVKVIGESGHASLQEHDESQDS